MTLKRKYRISPSIVIEDDGHWLTANVTLSEKSSSSIGVKRPKGPLPSEFRVVVSLYGKLFYLLDYTDMHGFWLGVDKYYTKEEVKENTEKGMFGTEYVEISPFNEKPYYRSMYSFVSWSIKDNPGIKTWPLNNAVKDYLSIQFKKDQEQERRFNEVIASSGRNLDWIISKIGSWVPIEEIPIVDLTDE